LVYYSEKGDKKDQIWLMDADGKNPTLLTDNIGHNFYPSFAPDGKVIFISSRAGEDNLVYRIDTAGSNLELIQGIRASYARISPDGKKIAYVFGRFPESDIFIANADGSGAVKLLKE
jgi:Tol biopolymer transport system component